MQPLQRPYRLPGPNGQIGWIQDPDRCRTCGAKEDERGEGATDDEFLVEVPIDKRNESDKQGSHLFHHDLLRTSCFFATVLLFPHL